MSKASLLVGCLISAVKCVTLAISPSKSKGSTAVDEVVPTCKYKCKPSLVN